MHSPRQSTHLRTPNMIAYSQHKNASGRLLFLLFCHLFSLPPFRDTHCVQCPVENSQLNIPTTKSDNQRRDRNTSERVCLWKNLPLCSNKTVQRFHRYIQSIQRTLKYSSLITHCLSSSVSSFSTNVHHSGRENASNYFSLPYDAHPSVGTGHKLA
jgi:hypothetical protein